MITRVWRQTGLELEREARSRTTHVLVAAMLVVAGLVAFGAVQQAEAASHQAAVVPGHEARLALGGVAALRVFLVLLGVLCVTSEYHHGDIVWRCLAEPSRGVLVAGKAVACAAMGGLMGLVVLQMGAVFTVASVGGGFGGLGLTDGETVQTVVGSVLGAALAGVVGVGVGAAVRNQTGAVVAVLVAVLLVEPLISSLVPAVAPYLPNAAASAAAGDAARGAWGAGLAVFTAYAAAAVGVGGWLAARRDV